MTDSNLQIEKRRLIRALFLAGSFVAVLWIVLGVEWAIGLDLGVWGIQPRHLSGLVGILTGPLIHGGVDHLLSNSGPLLVLMASILFFYHKVAFRAITWIYLMTGLWVWVGARNSFHIGASGLVYGMAAFMFFSGIFRKDLRALALAIIVAFLYGSMIWGVFPQVENNVSWESHLYGALAGMAVAFALRKIGVPPRKRYSWEDEPEYELKDDFAVWNYQEKYFAPRQHPDDVEEQNPPEITPRYHVPPRE